MENGQVYQVHSKFCASLPPRSSRQPRKPRARTLHSPGSPEGRNNAESDMASWGVPINGHRHGKKHRTKWGNFPWLIARLRDSFLDASPSFGEMLNSAEFAGGRQSPILAFYSFTAFPERERESNYNLKSRTEQQKQVVDIGGRWLSY